MKTFILISLLNLAQETPVEMATDFRGEGKIFIVVAIVLLELVGLLGYVWWLERRLKKLEK